MKNEIQIRFSMWCECGKGKVRQNSNAISIVWHKRKSNLLFSVIWVDKKWKWKWKWNSVLQGRKKMKKKKWNLNSIFSCHQKKVGTKVHALVSLWSLWSLRSLTFFFSAIAVITVIIVIIYKPEMLKTKLCWKRSKKAMSQKALFCLKFSPQSLAIVAMFLF